MSEVIGWLGSLCLALCGAPQAWASIKQGHSWGISWGFLTLWLAGEILTMVYVLPFWNLPLLANYTANIVFLGIIIYYKRYPR